MIFLKKLFSFNAWMIFVISVLSVGAAHAQDQGASKASDNKVRLIDGVVVVVNTGFITRKEIDDRVNALKKQGTKAPDEAALRKEVLERLILEKIQIQNAEREGFSVNDKELNSICLLYTSPSPRDCS